jgi:hypothetical protein
MRIRLKFPRKKPWQGRKKGRQECLPHPARLGCGKNRWARHSCLAHGACFSPEGAAIRNEFVGWDQPLSPPAHHGTCLRQTGADTQQTVPRVPWPRPWVAMRMQIQSANTCPHKAVGMAPGCDPALVDDPGGGAGDGSMSRALDARPAALGDDSPQRHEDTKKTMQEGKRAGISD